MQFLQKNFDNKVELTNYVKELCPWAKGETSSYKGGKNAALESLSKIDPINYGNSRNFGDGKVTKLSFYLHHGIINLNEVRNHALTKCTQSKTSAQHRFLSS